MKLHELHVLQRQTRAQHHAAAIAGAGVRRGAGKVGAAIAAGGEDGRSARGNGAACPSARSIASTPRHSPSSMSRSMAKYSTKNSRLVADRLLVERMQHRVPGAVGGRAGALRDALAVVRGHAAEGPLIDAAVVGARERHAVVLELDHRGRRLLAHELDGVLVAEPVRALDGVVHVPAPVVLAHVGERGADAALRRHGVAAGGKHLGDAGGGQSGLGQSQGRAQAGAAGADHHHVIGVIDELVGAHAAPAARSAAPRRRRRRRAAR